MSWRHNRDRERADECKYGEEQQKDRRRQTDEFADSKVHGPNMGNTWVLSAPDGPHIGPMGLAFGDGNNKEKERRQMFWPTLRCEQKGASVELVHHSITRTNNGVLSVGPVPLIARFMGPTWAHLGLTGPRWAPCWSHERCYLGKLEKIVGDLYQNTTIAIHKNPLRCQYCSDRYILS